MEHLQSETSSETEALQATIAELNDNLNWTSAILAVLLHEAGGAVEINREDLGAIKLKDARANITYQPDTETFLVEAVPVTEDADETD